MPARLEAAVDEDVATVEVQVLPGAAIVGFTTPVVAARTSVVGSRSTTTLSAAPVASSRQKETYGGAEEPTTDDSVVVHVAGSGTTGKFVAFVLTWGTPTCTVGRGA